MTENTLKITFKKRDEHRDAARERLKRAERGESGEAIKQDVRYILNFEEYADLARFIRQPNLELVEAIVEDQPNSIRQAATAVDRDYREVHRNLQDLESLGVVEFEQSGQRKKPILRGGAENIDVSIQFPPEGTSDTRSALP